MDKRLGAGPIPPPSDIQRTLSEPAERIARARAPETERLAAWCELVRRATGEEVGDAVRRLSRTVLGRPAGPLAGTAPLTILAGAAGSMSARQRELLEPLLRGALRGYDGVLLSGGTAVGLPGLVGELARELRLRIVGYVPAGHGDATLYPELRETPGASEFSVREPLAMWTDILGGGIDATDVRLVACPGGPITDAEVALAVALGAGVAWIDPAADAPAPPASAGVLVLGDDATALRAFVRRADG